LFRSSLEDEGVADTEQMQIIEGVEPSDSAAVLEGTEQYIPASNDFRSQELGDERV